jgi:hypothetical protein
MTARNASNVGDWEEPVAGSWEDAGIYVDDAAPAPAPRRRLLRNVWTGRQMVYILAVALIAVTALVLLTRPDAAPIPPAPAVTTNAPPLITYDAGPVIENEFNKP